MLMRVQGSARKSPFIPRPLESLKTQMNEIYQSGVTEEVSSEGGTPMVPTVLLTATIPIGLTLVQRLVKLHGGSVEARSSGIGQGSEFIVRLPILTGPVVAPPPPALSPASAGPKTRHRMLIVDDNEDSARSMAMLQSRRNYETRTAFTGPAAVAAAAEFAPEVVLLDIGLPGMDGFEVARRLRAMPALAGAILVAMSGYGSDEDRAEARDAGFDEYLVKPVDLGLLRERLRSRD